jgi:hypothetical protein
VEGNLHGPLENLMNSKHKNRIVIKKKDVRVRVHDSVKPRSWLKWLSPAARKKAEAKLRRSSARTSKGSKSKHAKSKGPHRKVWVPRPPPVKANLKNFSPVFVKGNRVVTNYIGYPGAGAHSDVVNQLDNDSYEWLKTWNTVQGDHRHAFPHSFRKASARYYGGWSYALDKFGNGNRSEGVNLSGFAPGIAVNGFDPTTYNTALGRLYDKLRGDIDLSIDLAEVHKTKTMMAKTVRGMVQLATTFRKMRRSNPQDWGNLWLEYTYGWKPLASSIYGAGHKLLLEPSGPRFMVAIGSAHNSSTTISSTGNGNSTTKVVETTVLSNRCKIVARFSFTTSALDTLAGFASLNPVSIAWELLPYSFVVDWFLNVGGYLRNFETACLYGTDFVDGYASQGWMAEVNGVMTRYSPAAANDVTRTVSATSQTGWAREIAFSRSPFAAVPFPKAPRFDPKLGSSRLISAAALLGQFVDVLGHQKSGTAVPQRLTQAERLLNAPKGAAKGPYAWLFR